MAVFIVALLLLCVAPALQERAITDYGEVTCSSDTSRSCSNLSSHAGLLSRDVGDNPPEELLLGRMPHRLSVADTAGIHISVKTAAKYHEERLSLLMLTWLQTIEPRQVHIVTDDSAEDKWTATAVKHGFHVAMASGCEFGHCRKCLCCKSGVEYEQYYRELEHGSNYNWFCHVDDDVYVNVPELVHLLQSYDPLNSHVYLGRWCLARTTKLELTSKRAQNFPNLKSTQFAFGTGALYCISARLMTELQPYLRGAERFMAGCTLLEYTDDMTVGATIEAILGHNFTDVDLIYSHLNALSRIPAGKLPHVVSISHGEITLPDGRIMKRYINVPNARFTMEHDHTRFLSYHCLLHPKTYWCS